MASSVIATSIVCMTHGSVAAGLGPQAGKLSRPLAAV
jgi:hypothetical protein